jgi:hypothetical protein
MTGSMTNVTYRRIGLAALILFAPGGFLLGGAMAAGHLRRHFGKARAARG